MKFKLEITIDAHGPVRGKRDLARMLHIAADKVGDGVWPLEADDWPSGPVRDLTGEKVGEWEVTDG